MPVFAGKSFYFVRGPTHICERGGLSDTRVAALQRTIQVRPLPPSQPLRAR